jgi:hypothetical protein
VLQGEQKEEIHRGNAELSKASFTKCLKVSDPKDTPLIYSHWQGQEASEVEFFLRPWI